MAELGISNVLLASVAKGPERNAGREHIYLAGEAPIILPQRSPVLYFIQRLRDEAHRYAIGTHRNRRAKGIGASALDEIPGIGPRRKRALLNRFGSVREIERAALSDLVSLDGISNTFGQRIYDFFHPDD
jgi:excinuclease ABC subunit C